MKKNFSKSFLVITILAVLFFGPKIVKAATWSVVNGGFESGPGVGWLEGCDWGDYEDCEGWVIEKNTAWAASGNWLASLSPGDSIFQTGITLPQNIYKILFSFDYVYWNAYKKGAAMGIFDSDSDVLLAIKTTENGGIKYNNLEYTRSYIDITKNKGRNISLIFYSEDLFDVDNVAISVYFGSVRINSGAKYTRSPNVTLGINAVSGTKYMRFSNNASKWTGWKKYGTSYRWNLASSTYGGNTKQGTKRVYIQFKDNHGNICSVSSDSIVYDKTFPTGLIRINNRAKYTKSAKTTLYLKASDKGSGVRYMRFSNNARRWTGWKRYKRRYSWRLNNSRYGGNSKKGKKYVYVQYIDRAGNKSLRKYDTIIWK
ncbi:MAG: hypothetical protein PHI88_00725 [Candidatus Pacebacteria bacterium]|nr:hypothetical protein [Candidatus Paceibacterota bacterium]